MEEVLEHYGLGLLAVISMVLELGIIFKSYSFGGVISQMVANYFNILCGGV